LSTWDPADDPTKCRANDDGPNRWSPFLVLLAFVPSVEKPIGIYCSKAARQVVVETSGKHAPKHGLWDVFVVLVPVARWPLCFVSFKPRHDEVECIGLDPLPFHGFTNHCGKLKSIAAVAVNVRWGWWDRWRGASLRWLVQLMELLSNLWVR
jgi:hypothetical protein